MRIFLGFLLLLGETVSAQYRVMLHIANLGTEDMEEETSMHPSNVAMLSSEASPEWSMQMGGGLGYKSPTIFDAQTEETAYKNVLPISGPVRAERSAGLNADMIYTGTIGEDLRATIDQAFFYTRVDHPLVLDSMPANGAGPYILTFPMRVRLTRRGALRRVYG